MPGDDERGECGRGGAPAYVAVPARDEREHLPACLAALDAQQARPAAVVVLLNNCRDGSEQLLARLAPELRVRLVTRSVELPPAQAHAGSARRLALEHASSLAGGRGVLLTTDADAVVPPDWIAANLAAIEAGADLVAGRAVIDPEEARAVPAALHEDDARECAYAELLDAIHHALDPDPADPWPRHTEHSGASLAVRAAMHDRVGGLPALALGEDRGFVEALRRVDARIRHAPEVWVTVSGRLEGRAAGGMADTMRRRIVRQDPHLDCRLEPAAVAARRARLRAALRPAWREGAASEALAAQFGLAPKLLAGLLRAPHFGAAWSEAEQASPVLRREAVARSALARETDAARALLQALRARTMAAGPGPALPAAAAPA